MKNSVRVLSVLLAVLLTASCTSCSTDPAASTASGTASGGTSDASSSTAATLPPPPEFEMPEVNLTNKTVKCLSAAEFDDYQIRMHEGMLRDIGVTVENEVVPYDSLSTLLVQKITSGESPDIYAMTNRDFPSLVAREVFLPLDDYIDFSQNIWEEQLPQLERWKWKGKMYLNGGSSGVARFVWYNTKIFKNADLPTPLELYDKGEWDWDKLLELAQELTVEDAEGKVIQYGFAGESLQFTFRGSAGEDYIKFDENGITNNFRNPNVAKAEKFLQDLALTYKVLPPSDSMANFDLFMQNKVAMGVYGHWYAFSAEGATARLKNGEIAFAPPPKAPGMEPYYYGDLSGILIPKGAPNPEGAAAYMTYRTYYGRVQETVDGKEVSPWMRTNIEAGWTDDMVRIYEEVNESPNIIAHLYHGVGNAISWAWEPYSKLMTGTPWETIVEEYAPKMEQEIELFNSSLK